MKTWRDIAAPIIARVIHETGTEDKQLLREKLREAYPFGPRKYWPYRVWLSEIAVQLGKRPWRPRKAKVEHPGQETLWD